jgi:hypothetical protein
MDCLLKEALLSKNPKRKVSLSPSYSCSARLVAPVLQRVYLANQSLIEFYWLQLLDGENPELYLRGVLKACGVSKPNLGPKALSYGGKKICIDSASSSSKWMLSAEAVFDFMMDAKVVAQHQHFIQWLDEEMQIILEDGPFDEEATVMSDCSYYQNVNITPQQQYQPSRNHFSSNENTLNSFFTERWTKTELVAPVISREFDSVATLKFYWLRFPRADLPPEYNLYEPQQQHMIFEDFKHPGHEKDVGLFVRGWFHGFALAATTTSCNLKIKRHLEDFSQFCTNLSISHVNSNTPLSYFNAHNIDRFIQDINCNQNAAFIEWFKESVRILLRQGAHPNQHSHNNNNKNETTFTSKVALAAILKRSIASKAKKKLLNVQQAIVVAQVISPCIAIKVDSLPSNSKKCKTC